MMCLVVYYESMLVVRAKVARGSGCVDVCKKNVVGSRGGIYCVTALQIPKLGCRPSF